jgi:hypothetical protein
VQREADEYHVTDAKVKRIKDEAWMGEEQEKWVTRRLTEMEGSRMAWADWSDRLCRADKTIFNQVVVWSDLQLDLLVES